ncbi:MAG: hypothetical protein GX552_01655 [Chloroflexi bacterium]|nr:hypothetical protein [Chloroflexota bacterium]
MKDDMRYIVGGASVGAILGALVGWLYMRSQAKQIEEGAQNAIAQPLDTRQLLRLGGAIVGVIRQVLELGN